MSIRFEPTKLAGVFLISAEPMQDERGSFARVYSAREFATQGLTVPLPVTARAFNRAAFTLRGIHYQCAPHEETKLVSCVSGRIFDVVVDVRAASPTRGQWVAFTLSAMEPNAVYVPPGCAHGYLTLTDNAVVLYQMTDSYQPQAERGVFWDDPALGVSWPQRPRAISERDRHLPALEDDRPDPTHQRRVTLRE